MLAEVERDFKGLRVSPMQVQGARWVTFRKCRNSGAGAIALAAHFGAQRIGLLGYDCQHTGGEKHWHGDHPKSMQGNAGSVGKWPKQFQQLADELRSVEIINLSRVTALTCWPRGTLEEFLHTR